METGSDLYAYFGQSDLGGQLFATVDIRVVRAVERLLELVQLVGGERGPVAPVFLAARRRRVVVVVVQLVAAAAADVDVDAAADVAQHRRRRRLSPLRLSAVGRALCRPADETVAKSSQIEYKLS